MEYSETSQIMALLTPDWGIIRGLAKGARRIKGNYEGGVDLFDIVDVVIFVKAQGLSTISESRLVARPMGLRSNPVSFMAASAARELVLKATAEYDPSQKVYGVMMSLLNAVEKMPAAKAPLALLTFELAFLESQGLAPEWTRCAVCGSELPKRKRLVFDASEGGLVCGNCYQQRHMSMKMSPGAIALAEKIRRESFEALPLLAPNRELVAEVQGAVKLTLAYGSFIVPKSLQYVWN